MSLGAGTVGAGNAARPSMKLLRGIATQLGTLCLTILGLLFVTFFIGRVIPIDPVLAIAGDRATPELVEKIRAELGLDLPLYQQFWNYLVKIAHGDLGNSVLTAKPIIEDIATYFPATIELAVAGTLIGVLAGVPLGVISAARQGSMIDHVVRVVALAGYSVPVFWLGLVGLLVFYVKLDWVSGPGRIDAVYEYIVEQRTGFMLVDCILAGDWEAVKNALSHFILPAVILGYYSMAYIARMTRSFMLEQLTQEYIVTARVKGVSERAIIWRHAFGNIRVPLITVIALSFAHLLEGTVLTETVFAWPGIGLYITHSLFGADLNAVLGGTIVVGVSFVVLNLLSDALYALLDPRARAT